MPWACHRWLASVTLARPRDGPEPGHRAGRLGRVSVPRESLAGMSYDLAVWEGERPADDKTAGRVFEDLYARYIDSDTDHPPTERIAAYVAGLLERWCDLTEDEDDTSPGRLDP